MIKVSIIILTYNSGRYLEETLDSCLKQSYQHVEIVVIDDASTDGTTEYLETLEGIVYLKNTRNLGISKNINRAVELSSGELVIFLGHDDILPPNHVKKMVCSFTPTTGLVHCNAIKINSLGGVLKVARSNKKQVEKNCDCIYYLSAGNYIQSCGLMFRKKVFQSIGGWDEKYNLYGEWLVFIKFSEVSEIGYNLTTFAFYRVHGSSIIKKIATEQKIEFNQYLKNCRSYALKSKKRRQSFKERIETAVLFYFNTKVVGMILHIKKMAKL